MLFQNSYETKSQRLRRLVDEGVEKMERLIRRLKLILLLLLISLFGYCQPDTKKGVWIGDKVPDVEFNIMYNYPGGKAKLSDFRGKLVILDFWNLHCVPCINAFPKMQKLQDKFGDKIQIITVNVTQPHDKLIREYGSFPSGYPNPYVKNMKLPMVFDETRKIINRKYTDSKIAAIFPHGGEPFHTWIDQSGVVIAMTDGSGATEENIEKALRGEKLDLLDSRDSESLYMFGEDHQYAGNKSSLIRKENGWLMERLVFSSVFMQALFAKTAGNYNIIDSVTKKVVGFRTEASDLFHVLSAYGYKEGWLNNVFFKVKDSARFIEPEDKSRVSNWKKNNTHMYELRVPAERVGSSFEERDKLFQRIYRQDVSRFLGVKAHFEKRKIKCWLLVCRSPDVMKKRLTTSGNQYFEQLGSNEHIQVNASFSMFSNYIKSANNRPGLPLLLNGAQYDDTPFYQIMSDGTLKPMEFDVTQKVDLKIECSLRDLQGLKRELAKYGLDIIEVEREKNVIVIEDSDDY